MKCRVWYKVDMLGNKTGEVSVSYPDTRTKMKPAALNMEQWIDKQLDDVAKKCPQFQGLEYDDMDTSQVPARDGDRDRCRGSKGKKIKIDKTVVLRKDVEKQLDDELAKTAPDVVMVTKLQRQLIKWEGR